MGATFAEPAKRHARILLVDDHALIRYGMKELLSHEPHLEVCGEAEDVDDALLQVEATCPDLIIIDISLKHGNGIELIKRISARHPNKRILVSSMHDESLFAERALHAGAHGYLNKQEATDKLTEAIHHVLDGHIYLSVEMTDNFLQRMSGNHEPLEDLSVERLTDRELEVFELIGQGLATRQIAGRLHISIKTADSHREHIRDKLNLANSAQLARHAVQWILENH